MKVVLFFSILFVSCNFTNQNEPIKSESDRFKIRYYYRDFTSHNDYVAYIDNFIIENFIDRKYSIRELEEFAKVYIDTVHSDNPICAIKFYAEKKDEKLPEGVPQLYYKFVDNSLVTINFNNGLSAVSKLNVKIDEINIWKKGEVYESITNIDSLIKSNFLISL
jgi:hypothetical protein